ncbi:MAG: cytochrome C oxidase subunit IV family protein [Planctomycetes bacterium]|nr:cytochrome C oxidase subunit IV family protein [Planctomycetota bacterium]
MAGSADHSKLYWGVFWALAALTVLTVGASYLDLGHSTNLWVGILIAVTKASLVATIFMHLKYEGKLTRGVAAFPICLFVLLSTVLVVDISNNWISQFGNKGAWSQPGMQTSGGHAAGGGGGEHH